MTIINFFKRNWKGAVIGGLIGASFIYKLPLQFLGDIGETTYKYLYVWPMIHLTSIFGKPYELVSLGIYIVVLILIGALIQEKMR